MNDHPSVDSAAPSPFRASHIVGPPALASTERPGVLLRASQLLRRHPILFLALLTPGIPEYLSGSSPLADIVLNPGWFVLGLGFNLGMYVPGVLLIREAQIRWDKGWATVLALGAAYAIVEEGIGLSTMFNPTTSPIGAAGNYGHFLGVNWVWVPEVMVVHMIFSIGIPLLLFSLVYPELRGRPLLSRAGRLFAGTVLAVDITLLAIFVHRLTGYWMGNSVLLGAILAVVAICALAYAVPKDLVRPLPGSPARGPLAFGVVGGSFYLGTLVLVSALERWSVPAFLVALSIPVFCAVYLWWLRRNAGTMAHERQLIAFAFGLILPILVVGAIAQIGVPFVVVADLLAILLFRHLWRKFPESASHAPQPEPPPGAATAFS
jgi:hypothetical protein